MVVLGDAGTDAPRHRESVESSMVQSVCPTLIYAMQNCLRHAYVATCVDGMGSDDTEVEFRRSESLVVAQVE